MAGSTQTLSATHSTSTLHGGDGSSSLQTGGNFNSEPVSLDSVASMGIIANTSGTERSRDLALCAVLLDEWLKELSAIALEQSVVMVTEQLLWQRTTRDSSYIIGYWVGFVDISIYSSMGWVNFYLNATFFPFLLSVKLSQVVLLLYFVFFNHSIRTNPQFWTDLYYYYYISKTHTRYYI